MCHAYHYYGEAEECITVAAPCPSFSMFSIKIVVHSALDICSRDVLKGSHYIKALHCATLHTGSCQISQGQLDQKVIGHFSTNIRHCTYKMKREEKINWSQKEKKMLE